MKIRIPLADVKDQLINFISEGYGILGFAFSNPYNSNIPTIRQLWEIKAVNYFDRVFPTKKESGQFLHAPGIEFYFNSDKSINDALNRTTTNLKVLEHILDTLERYYQFEPESIRLFIEQIDSFSLVRGINHAQVEGYLESGFFKYDEKAIKRLFAEIIGESFVPNDHGGETEDLYTSRLLLNGERVQTSIILNGPGKVQAKETRMKDLGASNQLERMMRTDSSKLYILQSVRPVGQDIVNTFEVFIKDQRSKGNHCYYCIIDGQDTATILYAYGFLNKP